MPGRHAAVVITTATEQKFARGFDVIVEDLPRLLRQLKSNLTRPTGLLLPHCGAIDRMPAWFNVLDPERDDAAPQLAVDCQIEHCQVTRPSVDLQSGTDRPNMFWPQRWLLADAAIGTEQSIQQVRMLVSYREQSGPGASLLDNSFMSTRPKLYKVKKLESVSASFTAYCTLSPFLFTSNPMPLPDRSVVAPEIQCAPRP